MLTKRARRVMPQILALAVLTACTEADSDDVRSSEHDAGAEMSSDDVRGSEHETGADMSTAALPALAITCSFDPDGRPPTIADLATSADIVAVGTVEELVPADGPWATVLAAQRVEECSNPAAWGVDIRLSRVIGHGPAVPEELTLRVTAVETATWSLRPVVDDGVVDWANADRTTGVGPGMRIGGFLTQVPGKAEFIAVGPLVWVDAEGIVHFQRTDEDCRSRPDGVEGSHLENLLDALVEADVTGTTPATEWVEFAHGRTGYCGDPPPDPIPCVVIEPGNYACGDGLECDTETMTCR